MVHAREEMAVEKKRLGRFLLASALGAGFCFGAGPFAFAQSVKVEFPAKPDPTELPEVWPEEAGVSFGPVDQAVAMDPRPEVRHPQPRHRQGREDRLRAL